MKLKLPTIIKKYIKASNEADLKAFIACFANTAAVSDEGEALIGHEAISKWFTKTRAKYQFKSKPIGIKNENEKIILIAKVSGSFPGSPVTLDYHFKIESGLIKDLKIL